MATTTPTRFDADLFEAARTAGQRSNRSAAQQLAHWAALGRELENSTDLTTRDLARFAAGASYDTLSTAGQAAARASMLDDITSGVATLDLRSKLAGRRRTSTADADGTVHVHRSPEE